MREVSVVQKEPMLNMSLFDDIAATQSSTKTKTYADYGRRLRKKPNSIHSMLSPNQSQFDYDTASTSQSSVVVDNLTVLATDKYINYVADNIDETSEDVFSVVDNNNDSFLYNNDSSPLASNLRGFGATLQLLKSAEYDVLSKEEERSIFVILKDEDADEATQKWAREEITKHNLRLVVNIAKTIYAKNKVWQLEELFQEGCCGLDIAINKFSLDKGTKFSTYAWNWIRQTILRAIADKATTMRFPVHYQDGLTKIRKAENEYCIMHNCEAEQVPIEKIAEMTGLTVDKIKLFRSTVQQMGSLDIVVDENATAKGELIVDENASNPESELLQNELTEKLMETLDDILDEREKAIIINKFNLHHLPVTLTHEEMAEKFNITKERVRQIETSAIKKLRNPSKSAMLRAYYYGLED